MTNHIGAVLKAAWLGTLLWVGTAAVAQNPQARPPQAGTGTGISADSAASIPLSSIKKARRGKPDGNNGSTGEPSDPHQVNGKATGGPDNKASQPLPGRTGGRGDGLSR